jgi:hypothetical protein
MTTTENSYDITAKYGWENCKLAFLMREGKIGWNKENIKQRVNLSRFTATELEEMAEAYDDCTI